MDQIWNGYNENKILISQIKFKALASRKGFLWKEKNMWIKPTPGGKIRYCERYIDYLTGKNKDVSVTFEKDTGRNRKEAAAILQKMIKEKRQPKAKSLTFGQLVEEYRKSQKLSVRASTYTRNYFALETIKGILGDDILVDRLNARYVQEKFLETDREPGTLNEFLTRFKSLLRWGYKVDLVKSIDFLNRLDRFPDKTHRVKIENKYLESAELSKVISCMKVQIWKYLTEFLALSGLRCGEAIALEKKDIDFKNHVIHITKTFNSNQKIVSPAKTINSIDDVYMQPELEALIHQIQAFMKQQQFMHNYHTELFFSDSEGEHINYFAFNKYFRTITLAVTGRALTTHSLRHTHASLLFEQGLTLDEVSRRLRHGNSKITKEVYVHVTDKLKEKDAERISKIHLIESDY